MSRMLHLKNHEPLASGGMRLVFRHPDNPEWLVKVIRPDMIDVRWGSGLKWYKRNRRFRQYISFVREISEYVAAHATYGKNPPFMQTVIGLAETDYGLGLVLGAALDCEGNLAPTLWKMVCNDCFDAAAQQALEIFFEQMLASNVVVADLHPGNLVYARDGDGGSHFVLIDGSGSSTLIPFKAMSRWLNHRSKISRIERLRSRLTAKQADLAAKKSNLS